MATTPNFALPYPVPSDPADVPADIQALANRLDTVLGTVGKAPTRTIITATGSYSPPAGCKAILVECWGGGGGGGGASSTAASQVGTSGGGGGGAYAASLIANPTGPYAVTIGAAGTAAPNSGVAAGNGGQTSFASLVVAGGGAGAFTGFVQAAPTAGGTGGAGGTATAGDLRINGQQGDQGWQLLNTSVMGAPGGASPRGGGQQSRVAGITVAGSFVGTFPGGGGASGVNAQSQATARAGGAGAAGLIIVTEY